MPKLSQLFYSDTITNNQAILSEEESRHCVKVLRLKKGDEVNFTDGQGNVYRALIEEPNPKKCLLNIQQKVQESPLPTHHIHIAIAPTKNIDRIEWFVEKAVEFGVQEISFIQCDRSERKQVKLPRIERIALSAMKQSLKFYLPKIHEMKSFREFLAETTTHEQLFVAHLNEGERLFLKNEATMNQKYCILIGPEGDFTPQEVTLAFDAGFKAVSLGQSRLRTETAGIAACHILNIINEV
ncbi:16S rRNA (uracil(1498)-N(3))-methyltransferase [marine bacterium AO1-C]|nr:16S rRNA (uracil(1498)-N(3))-methyltransferase [marine bacterium AO1-C]